MMRRVSTSTVFYVPLEDVPEMVGARSPGLPIYAENAGWRGV